MPRPCKKRLICHRSKFFTFGPLDSETSAHSKKVILKADQLEAMRLADLEGMSQSEAAESMDVSRQTFGRIIEEARKNVTFALVNGYTLTVDYDSTMEVCDRKLKCSECGHEWLNGFDGKNSEQVCPECRSLKIQRISRCGKLCECSMSVNKFKKI